MATNPFLRNLCVTLALLSTVSIQLAAQDPHPAVQLPNGRLLGEVPGKPREINNLATAAAVSPDGRFVVFLHSGFGAYDADHKHSYQSRAADLFSWACVQF